MSTTIDSSNAIFNRAFPQNKYGRDILLIVLICVFMVATETWLFKQDALLNKIGIAIRLAVPVLIIIFFRKHAILPKGKVLLALYGLLFFYLLCTVAFSENISLVALNTAKYSYMLTFPLALLIVLRPGNFTYKFLYAPVVLGLLFAVQTIVLFALIQAGHPPQSHMAILVASDNRPFLSYGLWGFAQGMNAIGTDLQVYRAQSFFGEPTNLASFLEVSTILSFGLYRIRNSKILLFSAILCAVALFLAFSMTAYVVIFLLLCFNYIVTRWKKMKLFAPAALILMICIIVASVTFYLQSATNPDFYARSKWGMAFGHSSAEIAKREGVMMDSLRLLRDHPLGIGIIGVNDSAILKDYPRATANLAPLIWMNTTGLIGLALQLVIIFYILKKIVIRHIKSFGTIERYIGLSFVAVLLHHFLAGDWFTSMFFYLLIGLVATDACQFSFFGDLRAKSRQATLST